MNTLMRNMGYPHAKDRPDLINGRDDVLEDDQFSLCCLCGKSFPTMRSLHIHINISHEEVADAFDFPIPCNISQLEEPCTPSGTSQSRPDFTESSTKSEKLSFCDLCNKSYPSGASFRVHMDTAHNGCKTPQCELCLKTFSTLSYLRMHIATVHEGVKPYSCSICDKSYTQKHSLKKHLATAHTGYSTNLIGDDSTPCFPRSGSLTTFSQSASDKARKKLLVDSPLSKDSPVSSPSCTLEVDTPSSSEG
ncbi:Zinc finger and BTB domain-containing protein 41 [Paragonimus heterotremus]|uniref:Zinc finger and BTB domain-containing protein 41 n=1 Tax=Paragonimus heterotremus TaxID=100268 RepID=A0A8J4TJH2_9TREM|nr:Zinc finger and BTB domain-containing protein 41 [Paragonimus heterotremus]